MTVTTSPSSDHATSAVSASPSASVGKPAAAHLSGTAEVAALSGCAPVIDSVTWATGGGGVLPRVIVPDTGSPVSVPSDGVSVQVTASPPAAVMGVSVQSPAGCSSAPLPSVKRHVEPCSTMSRVPSNPTHEQLIASAVSAWAGAIATPSHVGTRGQSTRPSAQIGPSQAWLHWLASNSHANGRSVPQPPVLQFPLMLPV